MPMTPMATVTDDITVDAAHLRGLTAAGPGWALVWHGRDTFTAPADIADRGTVFEIIDWDDLTALHDAHARRGQPAEGAAIAADITGRARTRLNSWRHTLTKMMAVTGPYTTALRPYGITRRQDSHPVPTGATATVVMPYYLDAIVPTTITITGNQPPYTVTVPRPPPLPP
ncbi:hypothetical protein AB0K16_50540 [Nonomuraea jabiensis]|uniref:hypothetical protein n=1 Tax=Nonomuraea jabiensis TaxID=882448 RepID=UPI003444A417